MTAAAASFVATNQKREAMLVEAHNFQVIAFLKIILRPYKRAKLLLVQGVKDLDGLLHCMSEKGDVTVFLGITDVYLPLHSQ